MLDRSLRMRGHKEMATNYLSRSRIDREQGEVYFLPRTTLVFTSTLLSNGTHPTYAV